MDYKVKVRHLRIGRRKVARLFPLVKGQYVQRALANLIMNPQNSSRVIQKAIKSAMANAVFVSRNINPDTLWVKEVRADQGPTLKRIRPRARGSADRVLKPMSHLTLVLTDEAMPEKIRRKKGVGIITKEMEEELAKIKETRGANAKDEPKATPSKEEVKDVKSEDKGTPSENNQASDNTKEKE